MTNSLYNLLSPSISKHEIAELDVYILSNSNNLCEKSVQPFLFDSDKSIAQSTKHPTRRSKIILTRGLSKPCVDPKNCLKNSTDGENIWPNGLIASLTHKSGHVGLAIDKKNIYHGVGIDMEEIGRVNSSIEKKIFVPSEKNLLRSDSNTELIRTLVFSFKEAIYKAINPQCHKFFYFEDAEITHICLERNEIHAKILIDLDDTFNAGYLLQGSFYLCRLEDQDYVITCCTDLRAS